MVALLLSLVALGHAEDDDTVLDTPPLGDSIPARIEGLEREWADDVGIKDPVEEPTDEPDAVREPGEAAHDDEPEPAKAPAAVEPPHAKRPSALGKPLGGDAGRARPSSDDPHAAPARRPSAPASGAEEAATGED